MARGSQPRARYRIAIGNSAASSCRAPTQRVGEPKLLASAGVEVSLDFCRGRRERDRCPKYADCPHRGSAENADTALIHIGTRPHLLSLSSKVNKVFYDEPASLLKNEEVPLADFNLAEALTFLPKDYVEIRTALFNGVVRFGTVQGLA